MPQYQKLNGPVCSVVEEQADLTFRRFRTQTHVIFFFLVDPFCVAMYVMSMSYDHVLTQVFHRT